jgi:hypothetical protein
MSDTRRAQAHAHPSKTNAVLVGVIALLITIVSLQVWLLTAGLNTALGGDRSIVWPAVYASLVLFLAGAGLLTVLPGPLRVARRPEAAEPFPNAGLAWQTLAISAVSLALAFAVWFMWSAITLRLRDAGFAITAQQAFWLTATPTLLGSLLRIPHGLIVSRYGAAAATRPSRPPCSCPSPARVWRWLIRGRRSARATVLGRAHRHRGRELLDIHGVVTLWFPKQAQGTALGINGSAPRRHPRAVHHPGRDRVAVFGSLAGGPQALTLAGGTSRQVWPRTPRSSGLRSSSSVPR